MQTQPNPSEERNRPSDNQEEALYASLGEAEEKQKSRYYKARQYFGKGKNIVSTATLLFVIAYTAVTAKIMVANINSARDVRDQTRIAAEGSRPYILLDLVPPNWPSNIFSSTRALVDEMTVTFKFTNYGKTPAIIKYIGRRIDTPGDEIDESTQLRWFFANLVSEVLLHSWSRPFDG
jgi:hypothetical protein